ncbi:hypothetical protein QNM99_06355 [Pseudomonas sp. PCH446]
MLIDTNASLDDLQTSAYQRLQAASDLLETMTCVSLVTTCDKDFTHVTNAAYLLVREGCDLLQLVQQMHYVAGQFSISANTQCFVTQNRPA